MCVCVPHANTKEEKKKRLLQHVQVLAKVCEVLNIGLREPVREAKGLTNIHPIERATHWIRNLGGQSHIHTHSLSPPQLKYMQMNSSGRPLSGRR